MKRYKQLATDAALDQYTVNQTGFYTSGLMKREIVSGQRIISSGLDQTIGE